MIDRVSKLKTHVKHTHLVNSNKKGAWHWVTNKMITLDHGYGGR